MRLQRPTYRVACADGGPLDGLTMRITPPSVGFLAAMDALRRVDPYDFDGTLHAAHALAWALPGVVVDWDLACEHRGTIPVTGEGISGLDAPTILAIGGLILDALRQQDPGDGEPVDEEPDLSWLPVDDPADEEVTADG